MSRNCYSPSVSSRHFIFAAMLALLLVPALGAAAPCIVPDAGSGTVSLPPSGCGYVSPADLHLILAGLPPGDTIKIGTEHERFFNVTIIPGGPLGGEREQFQSFLKLNMKGTGTHAGYVRVINMQAACETHVGPRVPGNPVQSFDTDMFRLQGQIPAGDPDFDLLRITAGTNFGMPSPGHTTLTRLQNGNWNVDSFFDITYRIEYIGHSPGPFAGMSGSTTGTIRMGTGQPAPPPCVVLDNGSGTANIPAPGCPYLSPQDVHKIIAGLPPGTTIRLGAEHQDFFNVQHSPGGSLGGEIEQYQSFLKLDLNGTGTLAGFHRTLGIQAQCETHTGPRIPGQPVQSFDTDMFRITGQLPPGDPDFDLLRVTAGTGFGMPSPGHTTLTRLPSGDWNIDSFFDITYRIDFIGHSPGPLAGRSGSTTATIRMGTGQSVPPPVCEVADNGSGTVTLPPEGCPYLSPADVHKIINGLPAGTTIKLGAAHQGFFNVHNTPDPTGGEIEDFDSSLLLNLSGTGSLSNFSRVLKIEPHCVTQTGPRQMGSTQQTFPTDMKMVQGQLPAGDPDFDLLRITGGTDFGMPSPGYTVLQRVIPATGPGSWRVYSYFDVSYRIDFVGAPGGPLAGRSGSTTGTIRMSTGQPPVGVPGQDLNKGISLSNRPNPFGRGTTVEYRLASAAQVKLTVFDLAGRRVRTLTDDRLQAGPHAMFWDGLNESGRKVGSGTYIIRLSLDGKVVASRRATMIR